MSSVVVAGNTSGSVTLSAPDVAGSVTVTLPSASGTMLTTNASGIASVNGIQFPATQSASADANCLDDYEEGTWTPSVGGSATYTARSGQYTRIGNQVTVWFDISISSIGSGSQQQISGLPFTCVSGTNGLGGMPTYWASLSASAVYISLRIDNATSFIQIGGSTGGTTTLAAGFNCLQNSSRIIGTLTYSA